MYSYEELKSKHGDLLDEQLALEARYKTIGMEITKATYTKAKADGQVDNTKIGQKFISHRFIQAKDAIQMFVEDRLAPKPGVKPTYTGILLDFAEAYKDNMDDLYTLLTFAPLTVTLNNLIKHRSEIILSNLSQWISDELEDEYNLTCYLAQNPERAGVVLPGMDTRSQAAYKRAYAHSWMKHDNYQKVHWNQADLMSLCANLLHVLSPATGYFDITPNGHKGLTIIEPSQQLLDAWLRNEEATIQASFRLCPMVIPPLPWENYKEGGYYGELHSVSTFLRLRDHKTAFGKQYLQKLNQMELTGVRKAINAIQSTPWKINTKVLKVMQHFAQIGGGRAGLPYLDQAPKPAVLAENATEEDIKAYKEIMIDYYKSETSRKSRALRALGQLKTAQEFSKYERIYFPCNMDFRGRVYPIPPFSFQGDDLNKGLILFADAPACTSMDDINWLAVHGANLAGVDKVSFADRIKWVHDNEAAILTSAADPIGETFWQQQDEPCQFLSFCFEWQAWKEWEKTYGTPQGFVSGIPVAFDGTCSGLQHFSAILRDPIGGHAVNLIPGEKPNDIYGIVAEKVNKMLDKDISSGTSDTVEEVKIKYGTKTLAQLWKTYGVTRKVTKRPTMTLAYGAKEYGFRDQIVDDTIDPDIENCKANGTSSVFNKYNKWQASSYMARLIWSAVGKTVVKAVEGMKWLQDCAKLVVKEGQVVTWVTPMGLPVQQSYLKFESKIIRMRCAGKFLRLYSVKATGDVDKTAQASGIAPNFIHSMDASHLQLTVCNSVDAGIHHFAMIHDSYGAPVAQAGLMFKTVRQSFIQMYTEHDVLTNFEHDMEVFADSKLPAQPAKGTLDIQQVLDSPYIFS